MIFKLVHPYAKWTGKIAMSLPWLPGRLQRGKKSDWWQVLNFVYTLNPRTARHIKVGWVEEAVTDGQRSVVPAPCVVVPPIVW